VDENTKPETGEHDLARILEYYHLIIRPYTYQGTARILLRELRQAKELETGSWTQTDWEDA
jgi:hypothetical protein